MARLIASVVSDDDLFRSHITSAMRAGSIPISVATGPPSADVDMVVVDARADMNVGAAAIEQIRAALPHVAVFAVAADAEPTLILQAMRAGANEFFAWPPPDDALIEALERTAARRQATATARQTRTFVFFGAKGGTGTTTLAVNCGVELANITKQPTLILDLKQGLGEVGLFLGIRSRYSVLDAVDNLHRLDAEFLKELVVSHKSGMDILAGSDQFERPGATDASGLEEVFRLAAQQYDYIVVDAGCQSNPCTTAALYTADTIFFVTNPDIPSVRNAQRLLDRIGQLGACRERVQILLNRASEPYPIPLTQIEAVLGHPIYHTFPSDYRTVSTALNSGAPVSQSGSGGVAEQFDSFTRRIIDPSTPPKTANHGRLATLGFQRIASIW
jgi:pilus assembly protein CpaE